MQAEETGSEALELPLGDENSQAEEALQNEPESSGEESVPVLAQGVDSTRTTPPRTEQELYSPYAGQQRVSEVPQKYAHLFDENVYQAVREMATEIAAEETSRALRASAQQRQAARQLGLPDNVMDEFGEAMQRHETLVPQEIRGTKQGAILALNAAMTERMMQTGDVAGTMRQMSAMFGDATQTQPAVQPKPAVIPPESRMPSPRGGTVRTVPTSKADDPFARLAERWGADDEEIKAVKRASEEAVMRGGR